MYFSVENDDLLEKHNNFFLKTKLKCYDDEVADFHDKEMPKAGFDYIFLAKITTHSALKKIRKLFSASVFKRMQIH